MEILRENICTILEEGSLDLITEKLIDQFCDENSGLFIEDECTFWDYKNIFPESFTENYCGGILRLICAFHNSYGGLIIFGVDDSERTSGHNTFKVNIELFNRFLRESLSFPIECRHISIPSSKKNNRGEVDVLVVPKRLAHFSPVTIMREYSSYPPEIIWFRSNAEVLRLQNKDLHFLFSERFYLDTKNTILKDIDAVLPNNPSTMTSFVGRTKIISSLWDWAFNKRDSRKYLYGDGGSGKTTIAYEFASLVSETGGKIKNYSKRSYDKIIWLSAKARALNTNQNTIEKISNDFSDSISLYKTILLYSELYSHEEVESDDIQSLLLKIEELVETINLFLIIDDIDTLITAQIDTGTDALDDIFSGTKGGSKILYTLRNLPGFSIGNAYEVPGLDKKEEYPIFIQKYCELLNVTPPPDHLIEKDLWELSEGRPLVLEVLIGLRRRYDNWDNSIDSYKNISGTNAREYMFRREYQALKHPQSKNLLGALYLWGKEIGYEGLKLALGSDKNVIADAIGEVTEMFLYRHFDDTAEETTFTLNLVAFNFIGSVVNSLDKYDVIKERIDNAKKGHHKNDPIIANLIIEVKKSEKNKDFASAYTLIFETEYPPKITERSDFRTLRGHVAMKQKRPNRQQVRDEMELACGLGTVRVSFLYDWLLFEEDNGDSYKYRLSICDKVINGKGYRKFEKAEFYSKKGLIYSQFATSMKKQVTDKAFEYYISSIKCNLKAYFESYYSKRPDLLRYGNRARTSIYYLFTHCVTSDDFQSFCKTLVQLLKINKTACDPLELFFVENKNELSKLIHHNILGASEALKYLNNQISNHPKMFLDESKYTNLKNCIKEILRKQT